MKLKTGERANTKWKEMWMKTNYRRQKGENDGRRELENYKMKNRRGIEY